MRDALPQPDPLRLRNREQLTEVVSAIVCDDAPAQLHSPEGCSASCSLMTVAALP